MSKPFPWLLVSIAAHCLLFFSFWKRETTLLPFSTGIAPLDVEQYRQGDLRSKGGASLSLESPQKETSAFPSSPPGPTASAMPTVLSEGAIQDASSLGIAPPAYPRLSRLRGEEGDVLLKLLFDPQRKLHHAEITHSSGYSALDQSALSRIQESFPPASPDSPKQAFLIRFKFRLTDSKQ